ncbi:MAG: TonB-dependent receptor [Cytophagales bacterium]|nr:MAG: TonB-dependent receptor [Cytophagales bacterium]
MFNTILLTLHLFAATLSGTIKDNQNQQAIADAQVHIVELNKTQLTDAKGQFVFEGLEPGEFTLKINSLGYKPYQTKIKVNESSKEIEILLEQDNVQLEEVVVQSITSNEKSGTTYTNVSAKELKSMNLGQDLPILLNTTPSIVTTSDAGAGVGYTGLRIRGTDATRINVTINGIPINDAESHGTFWVNMPDLASSVENIQIQRGVGTSSNGAAAFGASLNIQTNNLSKEAYGQISSSAGSFNTLKNTLQAGTGLINNRFAFETRLSKLSSDGFIDRASSDLKSFFISGAYFGKKSILKTNIFSGKEKTYQAWNGVPENILKAGNRTFNEFTYANQTDNYQQDHYQVLYTNHLKPFLNFNTALFYTRGRGYYEEYKNQQSLADYKISDIVIGNDTVSSSDLIRQKWLDNHFYGFTFSTNYNKGKLDASLGGGWNQYLGGHYGKVIWSRFAGNSKIGDKYYENDATKNDMNIYAKAYYQLLPKVNLFIDLQWRSISYDFIGIDQLRNDLKQNAEYLFFNPKTGFTWKFTKNHFFYSSISIGQKEPTRGDFVFSSPSTRPKSEQLTNLETGLKGSWTKFNYTANFYWMDYKNQLVVTGKLDDVGNSLRTNIDNSYRTGLELQGNYTITKKFIAGLNMTLSRNRIKNFTQIVYDENFEAIPIQHSNVAIAFSPDVIVGGQISYTPTQGLSINLLPKYVSRQYLDNTNNDTRALDPYAVADLRINYEIPQRIIKNLSLTLLINNILDYKYNANGYTYTMFENGKEINYNFYYPQAGRNFLAGATLRF